MTDEDRRLLFRVGLLNQQRPLPPQSVRFESDALRWDEPGETGNITHYLVRVGGDTAGVWYKVPVGTTAIRPGVVSEPYFVSSWNETMKSESQRVFATGSIAEGLEEALGGGKFDDVTLWGLPTITKNPDGTLTISVQYIPPYVDPVTRSVGTFAGVQPVYEGPDGEVEPFSDQPYLADPTADPPANLGTVSITRRFTSGETFYLHALAWAWTGVRKTYKRHDLAPSSRWIEVTVTVDDLVGYPTDGNVTDLEAEVLSTRVDQAGKQWAKIRATYGIVPGLETYRAYAYLGDEPPEDVEDWGAPLGESTGTRIDFEVEIPEEGGTYQIAVTASPRGYPIPITAGTPVTTVTLDAQGKAPQVTSFFVQVLNVERNGIPVVELALNFTKPVSTNWAGVKFQIRAGVSGGGFASGSEWQDYGEVVTTKVTRFWGVPTSEAQYYHIQAFSVSPAGKVNEEDTPPTDFVTIGAGAGIDLAKAKDLSYTSDFAIVGNQLTVQGVNFGLAYGFDSAIFEVSAGAFTVKELVADKIVTGTLGGGVIYAGKVEASQLKAGTATLTGSLTLDFLVGDVVLNQDGIACNKGAFSGNVNAKTLSCDGTQFASRIGVSGIGLSGQRITAADTFRHWGSTVDITDPSAWRTELGLVIGTDVAAQSHNHDSAYAAKRSITGATLTLAKITPGGSDGSITLEADGTISAYTAPT